MIRFSLVGLLSSGCAASPKLPSSSSSPAGPYADVVDVDTSGDPEAFTFEVAIRSEETGCDRYANWWEVISRDGDLLYRRILGHSHPSEQPFTRSGGPVPIAPSESVWVRAHMHPHGYGGQAWFGSPADGFQPEPLEPRWDDLATQAPLPDGCAF